MTQTTASGDELTLLCGTGRKTVSREQAEAWLRQRQAAQAATHTLEQRRAS